jgi:hypothetical protein
MLIADCSLQIRHLHRRQRCLKSLVPHLQPGPIDGLLESLASEHPKRVRHARVLSRLSNAARNFVDDHVVVRGVPPQQTTETYDRVMFLGFRDSAGSQWDFKRPRHADNLDVFLSHPGTQKPVISASKQTLCDELIETGDNDREAKT